MLGLGSLYNRRVKSDLLMRYKILNLCLIDILLTLPGDTVLNYTILASCQFVMVTFCNGVINCLKLST